MPQQAVEPAIERLPFSREGGTAGLRDLVVFLDGRTDNAGTVEFAAALAKEHGAHLTGVFIQPEPAVSQAEMYARGKAIHDIVEAHDAQLRGIEADRRQLFERAAAGHGIRAEWRVLSGVTIRDAAKHARYGDLAVVARHDPLDQRGSDPGLVESIVLTSGRPTIVLPPRCATRRVRRVVVGWNAEREAARAVADALPLLLRAEAVAVLTIDTDDRPGGHGQEPGADVARHLARHGTKVDVRQLSSGGEDAGHVLLSQAEAFRADLVVIGAYGHSRLTEWVFGGVTRTVLREARLPVLMSR